MIARVIEFCARNRLLVLILTGFLIAGGVWTIYNIRLDAIPDLSDVQVIILTEYPGQAPQVVEEQVTYPLTTSMLAVPYAKVVRGYSMFGYSFVYIIFEDGTDIYWARSRVLEYLNYVSGRLPKGVTPQLGPDATGVGWVYEYSVRNGYYCPEHPDGMYFDPLESHDATAPSESRGEHAKHARRGWRGTTWYATRAEAPAEIRDRLERVRNFEHGGLCPWDNRTELKLAEFDLAELRSIQDWYLRYELTALEGVAEVAPVGGFVRQYQVVVDPDRLLAYGIPLGQVVQAIQKSNIDVGGSVLEMSEMEYMIRGKGYLAQLSPEQVRRAQEQGMPLMRARAQQGLEDLKKVVVRATPEGTPVYLQDLAQLQLGPEMRRGIAEADGEGEVVGGIVVMRFGENAHKVIGDVKRKLDELRSGLPPGVDVFTEYDRSGLIERAVETLTHTLVKEMIVVGLVCILFLLHARSELVAIFVLPTGVLCALIVMHLLGINANIMSLGGIAISIGVMVDSSIVMVENAHKHLDREEDRIRAETAAFEAGQRPAPPVHRPRAEIIIEAAREVGPTLFFSLMIITVSFLPVFVLGEQSGRMFKPLAYTKTFSMAAASLLAITIIPVLMISFITARVLPKRWGRWRNLLVTLATMLVPAAMFWHRWLPLGDLDAQRHWIALGWAVLAGMLLVPQKIIHEHANPISWLLQRLYHPFFVLAMRLRYLTLAAAVLLVLSTVPPLIGLKNTPLVGRWLAERFPALAAALPGLGREFMPPLDEGDLLYMPTTDPAISVTKARELLQQTDALIRTLPEVHHVFGKIGRAESATDPAPLSMVETTIMLEPDRTKWRQRPVDRWFSGLPRWLKTYSGLTYFWPESRPITVDELCYGWQDADGRDVPGLDDVVAFPGVTNAWTMPIRTRIDMLSTGIKTPVGIKIMGDDLPTLGDLADRIAAEVRTLPGTLSAYPEKTIGGMYVEFDINRDEIARYGLAIADVQDVILTALGGMNITQTVEGLERYPVNVRYKRELRDNLPALRRTLVSAPAGAQVPLAQLADVRVTPGPPMIRSENSRKSAWVFVDLTTTDVVGWIERAKRLLDERVALPAGCNVVWSGQYEYIQAASARLKVAVPLTLLAIIFLLYVHSRSWFRTIVVLLAVPFSLVGAVWILYLLDYNLSLAVVIGMIALAGLDAETGMVMLLYLDNSFERFRAEGRMATRADLWHAIHDGAVMRIRPKMMTVATTFIGLVPLLWAEGTGADTMRRLAAPMIGGLTTSFIMELLIYPVIFSVAKQFELRRTPHASAGSPHALMGEPA
ncbi:MAG: efflux RND transporter permease subunit [Phycisphaerae bacterium]|jgi:Cu(I)/Ag(I) efflux system membrane protein CusA/SilA